MKKEKNRLFFCQTVQDTISLNFSLPIRTISISNKDVIFNYCKNIKFLSANYENYDTFANDLKDYLYLIPNFLNKEVEQNPELIENLKKINTHHLKDIRKYIYFSKSSLNPFFMASLNDDYESKVLKTIYYLYLIFLCKEESNILKNAKFFNFSYKYFHSEKNLFLIGPVMSNEAFLDDENRLSFVKNLKNYFELNLHTYELLNMLNQRNVISEDEFELKAQAAKKVLLVAQNNFIDNSYEKTQMRELSTHFIVQSKTKKISKIESSIENKSELFKDTYTKIKDKQILRDLEALEWFNDLTFQNLSFETTDENLKIVIINYLQNMIQADGYITCRYIHSKNKFLLQDTSASIRAEQKNLIQEEIERLNSDKELLESSYTYDVIKDYQEHKNPIKLVEDMKDHTKKLCLDAMDVNSVLSIPLVFDKRVFMVIHFISYESYRFDEIDKRFLLKLSSALSKQHIVNDLNSSLDKTVSLLEGLNKTTNLTHEFLKQKTDEVCQNITQAFSSDGIVIWFNKREVFQTPKEVNQLSILSHVNFLSQDDLDENQLYTIADEERDSLIVKNAHKQIVVMDNVEKKSSNNKKDESFMKYQKEFMQKGIKSMMFVPIKNHEGKLSGAVMIYDKSYRNYNQISKRMLKRISLYIGSILGTITYTQYRAHQIDEKTLHESAQYLNIINSRIKDLEMVLKKFNLSDSYEKHKLFLNIQDIKDFTSYTRNYLFSIFRGGKLVIKQYDELLLKSINEIKQNQEYIPLKKSVNQVLAVNKDKMNRVKDIIYKNNIEKNYHIKIPQQQLHDVLANMVNNAIKYGKIGTYIKIWDEEVPPYFYNIYIENIGQHIYKEEFDRIFENGFRGYNAKKTDEKELKESLTENKGVGLYLAKGIVKNGLGGNVKLIESSPMGKTGFNKNIFLISIPYKITRKVR